MTTNLIIYIALIPHCSKAQEQFKTTEFDGERTKAALCAVVDTTGRGREDEHEGGDGLRRCHRFRRG